MEKVMTSGPQFMNETEKRWVETFIPKRFRNATFDTYKVNKHNQKVYNAALTFIRNYDPETTTEGLILGGTIGTGKTHLLFAMGREAAKTGKWPIYKNFARVCIDLKDAWRQRESGEHVKELLLESRLLLLDDLGAEMREKEDGGWITELLYEIVETRYNNMLPTVIATNLNLGDIAGRYTPRIASRLVEMGTPLWVEGYDYRRLRRAG